jgi:hypothetical protein
LLFHSPGSSLGFTCCFTHLGLVLGLHAVSLGWVYFGAYLLFHALESSLPVVSLTSFFLGVFLLLQSLGFNLGFTCCFTHLGLVVGLLAVSLGFSFGYTGCFTHLGLVRGLLAVSLTWV